MDPFTIFSILMSVMSSAMGMYYTDQANEENVNLARETREDQQAFAQQSAEQANAATQQMYYTLYSPMAKKRQITSAGLSLGLMYGNAQGAGGSAAQAASPSAATPVVNPLLQGGPLSEMFNAAAQAAQTKKTEAEAQKTATEIDEIKQKIEESKTKIKQMEAQTGNTEVSTANMKLEGKLLEYQIQFQEGTIEEQIQTVKDSLELLDHQRDQAWEILQQMKVDTKYKEQFKQKEFEYLDEQTKLVVNQQLLVLAQTLKEQAHAKLLDKQAGLTEKQAQELQYRIDAIEKFGYMIVNGNGWQDRIINGLMEIATELGELLGKKRKEKMGGAGGKF